jgi:hypothetical protein
MKSSQIIRKNPKSRFYVLAAVFLALVFLVRFGEIRGTVAMSTDLEKSEKNKFAAAEWGKAELSGPKAGDIIINELMWGGSSNDANDEWIEIRNLKNHEIDLSNCDIENGGSGAGHIEIPSGYTIKAKGYFLITRKKWNESAINFLADLAPFEGITHVSGMNLLNDGEKLTLEDKENNLLDIVWMDATVWPAGSNTVPKKSMQRKDPPADGTQSSSWETCTETDCSSLDFWHDAGTNFGSPGKVNIFPNPP